jgi:hypothetical protein
MEIIETSVTPLSLVDELLIYPNPAKDQFTVEFYNPNHRYYDLTLYSIFGKKVFKKQNISGEKVEIETGALLPGVYFVRLIGENSMTGKILIE